MSARGTFQNAEQVRRWSLGLLGVGAALGDVLYHFAPDLQLPLALALIAGIGVQHGALDHILHAHMHGDPEGPLRQSFVLPYIAGIGLAWAAFELAPPFMLGAFLLLSAYHFGMSHLRVDHLRHGRIHLSPAAGLALGLALIAPLVLRPDALEILSDFGWDFGLAHQDRHLPLHVSTGVAAILALLLHRGWRTGWLPLAGALLAWFVHDLLLAFSLYFVLGHSREAFFEEFKERQSLTHDFRRFYLRSLPLSLAFVAMAGAVLWLAHDGVLRERAALSFLLAGTLPHIAVLEGWVTARTR